jgi:argininosuccinate lyase
LANVLQRDADVPFHVGHRFASALVTHGRAAGLTPESIPFTDAERLYRAVAVEFPQVGAELPLTGAQFRAALDPATMVRSYRGLGGPQPAEVERMLAAARDSLRADTAWVDTVEQRLAAAEAAREAHFADLVLT